MNYDKKTICILDLAIMTVVSLLMCGTVSGQSENRSPESRPMERQINLVKAGNEYVQLHSYTGLSAFLCPMDCEKGAIYHKQGKCPECEMNLKQNKVRFFSVSVFSADKQNFFPVEAEAVTIGIKTEKEAKFTEVQLEGKLLDDQESDNYCHFAGYTHLAAELGNLTVNAKILFSENDTREVVFELKNPAKLIQYTLKHCIVMPDEPFEEDKEITLIYEGMEFKMCCKGCILNEFNVDPEKFLNQLKKQNSEKK
jgi:hypothetical protein